MESKCLLCGPQPRRSVHLDNETLPPFHHLAICNVPPTDSEMSDIQATILPDVEGDIATVNSAINTIATALQSLEQQRDALNDVRQRYRNIIAIQRRIPQEIWSEIFLYAHSSDSDAATRSFLWRSGTIWRLSQVCQTWRSLALSLRSCWSSIVLDCDSYQPPSEKEVELSALVLERSRGHLLDIHINNVTDNLPFRRMREKVVSESMRWRKARFTDWEFAPAVFYAPLCGRLPQLEVLDVVSIQDLASRAVSSAFKDCPRLVNVGLEGTNPRALELPVKQLTILRLCQYWNVTRFEASMDLVKQCPLLETLHVDFHEGSLRLPHPQSITLPCLRDLKAGDPYVLDALTLPRLEVANINHRVGKFHPDTLYSFYSLIQRSNCASNITELRICQVPLRLYPSEPHLLHSILSQTTALARLELNVSLPWPRHGPQDDCSVTQVVEVMKALEIVPRHRVTFLPQLVFLNIHLAGHTNLDCIPYLEPHDSFVAMLKARHAGNEDGVSRLGLFHFCLWMKSDGSSEMGAVLEDHTISVLHGLQKDGMDLSINVYKGNFKFEL